MFVDAAEALAVHDVDVEDLPLLLNRDRLRIEPKPSGAGVHRGVYCKCLLFPNQLIHQEWFASTVATSDANDCDFIMRLFEYPQSFFAYFEIPFLINVDELDSPLLIVDLTSIKLTIIRWSSSVQLNRHFKLC